MIPSDQSTIVNITPKNILKKYQQQSLPNNYPTLLLDRCQLFGFEGMSPRAKSTMELIKGPLWKEHIFQFMGNLITTNHHFETLAGVVVETNSMFKELNTKNVLLMTSYVEPIKRLMGSEEHGVIVSPVIMVQDEDEKLASIVTILFPHVKGRNLVYYIDMSHYDAMGSD